MSRKPKITMKQAEQRIEALEQAAQMADNFIRVLMAEADKANIVIIRLLEKMDLLHSEECSHCGFKINTPLLEDILIADECPACEKSLRDDIQTTLPIGEEE